MSKARQRQPVNHQDRAAYDEIEDDLRRIQERQQRYALRLERQDVTLREPPQVLARGRHDPHQWCIDFQRPSRQTCARCGVAASTDSGAMVPAVCHAARQAIDESRRMWTHARDDGSLAPPVGDEIFADYRRSRDPHAAPGVVWLVEEPPARK
jgi:hypothetical protein